MSGPVHAILIHTCLRLLDIMQPMDDSLWAPCTNAGFDGCSISHFAVHNFLPLIMLRTKPLAEPKAVAALLFGSLELPK